MWRHFPLSLRLKSLPSTTPAGGSLGWPLEGHRTFQFSPLLWRWGSLPGFPSVKDRVREERDGELWASLLSRTGHLEPKEWASGAAERVGSTQIPPPQQRAESAVCRQGIDPTLCSHPGPVHSVLPISSLRVLAIFRGSPGRETTDWPDNASGKSDKRVLSYNRRKDSSG